MTACLNIVVVEDYELLRIATVDILRQQGHEAVGFSCAEELAEYAGAVDLFLLDLNLPGEDGLSLAQRIRQTHPGVGIIMMTGRTDVRDKIDGYQAGADSYLPKPVAPEELLAVTAALFRRLKSQPSAPSGDTLQLDCRRLILRGSGGEMTISL